MKNFLDTPPQIHIKIFFDYLAYLLVKSVEAVMCLIPSHDRALGVGRFIGRAIFALSADRRNVAIENLTIAFGNERPAAEIRLLARKNFEHLGMLGVEMFRLKRWTEDELSERLVFGGKRNFNYAFSPGRHGIFLVMAHFGSFEVNAAVNRFLGLRGNVIATGVGNRFVDQRILFRRGGTAGGLKVHPHRGIVRKIEDLLRDGELVGALADQRGDDTRPVRVSFFGREVFANGIFARFAMTTKAHVISLMNIRTPSGRYYCEWGEEIPIENTGDVDHDVAVNCQRFHDVAEKWLRKYPEQGFWMHRKFKRKPKSRLRRALSFSRGKKPV
ncbi:MAG: hypothetical protein V2B18_10835 [Pseudomonadota bacterium]